jgi:hypothetical protein
MGLILQEAQEMLTLLMMIKPEILSNSTNFIVKEETSKLLKPSHNSQSQSNRGNQQKLS